MSELEVGSSKRIYCNTCKGKTRHELKAIQSGYHNEDLNDDEPPLYWEEYQYRFWVCQGCNTATLEVVYNVAGELNSMGNKVWNLESFYPKREFGDRPLKRFSRLNKKLEKIYNEVVRSFNAGLSITCAMGLRALIEGICVDKGITKGNLEQKIDKLESYVPKNIVENLHSFRFIGNEAAHELEIPQHYELRLAIEVIEDLLNFLYDLEYNLLQKSTSLMKMRERKKPRG